MSAVAVCGVVLSQRAVEYAWPYSLLFLASILFRQKAACELFSQPSRVGFTMNIFRWITSIGVSRMWCFSALIASAVGVHAACAAIHDSQWKACHNFARWVRAAGIPPGTIIGNVNWSDFPTLFYALPECRYLLGLDPMFGMAAKPEAVAALESFRTGRRLLTPSELERVIGTRLAFVSIHNAQLAADMALRRSAIVYQGDDGWLFDLQATPAN